MTGGMDKREAVEPPAIVCLGSGAYVSWGWRWKHCPECGAAVWRDAATLGLVVHAPGTRGEEPIENEGQGQD